MGNRPAGALEHEVLVILAASDKPLVPAAVQQLLPGHLAYTTVLTALTRLLAKGAVARERAGRGYAYSFVADASMVTARRMRRLMDRGQDRRSVLASFVAELGADDESMLSALLAESRPQSS